MTSTPRSLSTQDDGPSAFTLPVNLRVSAYERVVSMILALLLISAFLVFALFLIWWAKRAIAMNRPIEIKVADELSGRGDHALGMARDLEEPGVEELADVSQPQLADTLAAVTTAVTLQPATLDQLLGESDAMGQGRGAGDSRSAGEGGEGDAQVIPRWDRWEIRFSASDVETYARQLDYFGVELAAFGGGRAEIDYASRLSEATPARRTASGATEQRLRFGWKQGRLQEFDRQLLVKAGIDPNDRATVQFAPQALENLLAQLENEQLAGRSLRQVRKTVFGVESAGRSYKLFVLRQELRLGL